MQNSLIVVPFLVSLQNGENHRLRELMFTWLMIFKEQLFSPFNLKIQKLISEIEKIYEWLYRNQKNLYARQIKFTISDEKSDNSFLDYLLLWLDGEKSTEMPRIESATDDTVDTDEDLDDDIAHDE